MKERDIVDFRKFSKDDSGNYTDSNGNIIDCKICYLHEQAYEKLTEDTVVDISVPHCPKCGKPMKLHPETDNNGSAIVGETNFYTRDGNIGYYPVFHCEDCDTTYALMPTEIVYHGGHDIFYTGGRNYVCDEDQNSLVKSIADKCMKDVEQYLERKEHPKDASDEGLKPCNLNTWIEASIEKELASWLYKNNLKK